MLNIKELNKAEVLAALYNRAKPQGMGFMHYDPKPMSKDEAQEILDHGQPYFDYLKGRVMKVDLSGDELEPHLYDRDNGAGAAQKALEDLMVTKSTNPDATRAAHIENTRSAAIDAQGMMAGEVKESEPIIPGVHQVYIDLSDVKDHLGPKVDEVLKKK